MDSFSIRDLRERTGELVRDAEAGRLSVVTKRGRPVFIAVPFDDALLEHGVNVALAVKLFADGVVTLSRAARVAGMSTEAFIETLGLLAVPVVDYPPGELDRELDRLA